MTLKIYKIIYNPLCLKHVSYSLGVASLFTTLAGSAGRGGSGTGATLALTFNAPINRADKCIALAVEKIQAAIRASHRVPLSVTPLSIPPEAETRKRP